VGELRPDAGAFPDAVKGDSNGWSGERWLDIRRLDVLGPIMQRRLDLCKQKGFDAVEPDKSYTQMLWMGLKMKAAYLPG